MSAIIAFTLAINSVFADDIIFDDGFIKAANNRSGDVKLNVDSKNMESFWDSGDGVYVYSGNAWNKNVDVTSKIVETYNSKGLDEPESGIVSPKPKPVEQSQPTPVEQPKPIVKEEPKVVEPPKPTPPPAPKPAPTPKPSPAPTPAHKPEPKKVPNFNNIKKETTQKKEEPKPVVKDEPKVEVKAPNLDELKEKLVQEKDKVVEEQVKKINEKVDNVSQTVNDKVSEVSDKVEEVHNAANEQVEKVKSNIIDTITSLFTKNIYLIGGIGLVLLIAIYSALTNKKKAKK